MSHNVPSIATMALAVLLAATSAGQAACYADYKAKQDKPLKLHYGVMRVDANPCQMSNSVRNAVASRLKSGGWKLLQVQSVFDDSRLEAKKKDAGAYFLRF